MRGTTREFIRLAAAAGLAVGAVAWTVPMHAAAQSTFSSQSTSNSVKRSASVTEKVTVKSVDMATRHLVVSDKDGELHALKVPEAYQNLGQLKAGDVLSATYTISTELVLSPPNAPLPPDTAKIVKARAAKGELPAAAFANHIVVTGAVLGIDMRNHTLKIVSPQGGQVHKVEVDTPEGQRAMARLKVGDKITAYITESLLISASPAT